MNEILAWWNGIDPDIRSLACDAAIVVAGLVAGHFAGIAVIWQLVNTGIDRYLRSPWGASKGAQAATNYGDLKSVDAAPLSIAMGWLVTLSCWAGAACWILWLHQFASTSDALLATLSRSWQAAVVVLAAVLAGGWLARTVYDIFQAPWLKKKLDAAIGGGTGGEGSFSETAARVVCVIIYAAFFLFVPVVVGGFFNLPPMAGLVVPAWEICVHLLTALGAFAIGYLGLAWIRSQSKQTPKASETHADTEYFVGLGIMVGTTLLALGLFAGVSSGVGSLVILLFLAVLAVLVWPVRSQLRDLWSGLMLRMQDLHNYTENGQIAAVKAVGPLMTTCERNGEEFQRHNSEVLRLALISSQKPS